MQLHEVAERCKQGDREAFALLYNATRHQLRDLCLSYVNDDSVADDILHDAFLIIFTRIGELKDNWRVEAWMAAVVRRVALLYLRRHSRQRSVDLVEAVGLADESHADEKLAVGVILNAVDALPDGYRRVFRLRAVEGMSHDEIAALLGIAPHSSSSQLHRARALLRRYLMPTLMLLLTVGLPLVYHYIVQEPVQSGGSSPVTQVTGVAETADGGAGCTPKVGSVEDSRVPRADSEEAGPVTARWPQRGSEPTKAMTRDSTANGPRNEKQHDSSLLASAGEQADNIPAPAAGEQADNIPAPAAGEQADSLFAPAAGEQADSGIMRQREIPRHEYREVPRTMREPLWSVGLAYSGLGGSGSMHLPEADAATNPMVSDSANSHRMPIVVSLKLERRLGDEWHVGAGLSYERMVSDFSVGNSYVSLQKHQALTALGIPATLTWSRPLGRRLELTASAVVALHLPLHATLDSHYLLPTGMKAEQTEQRLHPSAQWSAGVGLGLQCNLTPAVGIFVQPTLHHYFTDGSGLQTWNTEHPFTLSLPLGVKIRLK